MAEQEQARCSSSESDNFEKIDSEEAKDENVSGFVNLIIIKIKNMKNRLHKEISAPYLIKFLWDPNKSKTNDCKKY